MAAQNDLFGCRFGDAVPEVDSADLRAVWKLYEHAAKKDYAGKISAIGRSALEAVCTPGANLSAIAFRRAMLQMLVSHFQQRFERWTREGQLDEKLFRVAACIPVKWMQTEVTHNTFPLDVEEFFRCLGRE